jgi:hypothetical protein
MATILKPILKRAITALLLIPLLATCANGNAASLRYQDVDAKSRNDDSTMFVSTGAWDAPKWQVKNGHLYLLIQRTRSRYNLYVEVDTIKWTPAQLQELTTQHPELNTFFACQGKSSLEIWEARSDNCTR